MERFLILLTLTCVGSVFACSNDNTADEGDDDDDTTSRDASTDGASRAAEAGPKKDSAAALTAKVENAGAACKADKDCTGSQATCETSLGEGEDEVELKGGYCTAMCDSTAECGSGAGCPFIEISSGLQLPIPASLFLPVPPYCLDKCDAKESSACRDGYTCKSIGDFVPAEYKTGIAAALFRSPAFMTTYCMPPIEINVPSMTPDAGRPDAGSTSVAPLDAGLDAAR
jgi:hypothetical protein